MNKFNVFTPYSTYLNVFSSCDVKVSFNTEDPPTILGHRLRSDLPSAHRHNFWVQGHRRRTHLGIALLYTRRAGAVHAWGGFVIAPRYRQPHMLEHIYIAQR